MKNDTEYKGCAIKSKVCAPFDATCSDVAWNFFYYDPNYENKYAYTKGKQIQHELSANVWLDCKGEPDWESGDNFRIKLEEPKPRRMIYRQLAEWVAKGNGQCTPLKDKTFVSSSMDYDDKVDNIELPESYKIRRWDSDEWIEPTVDVYNADCKKE